MSYCGQSIKVGDLFALVREIKRDIEEEKPPDSVNPTRGAIDKDDLDIKSEDLRLHFQKHLIVPFTHSKYKRFFTDKPAEIALTYQWSSSFSEIRGFLNQVNVRRHNHETLDPNPTIKQRLYLMSFVWIFFGPLAQIPDDIDSMTMFIDIMANDQNRQDFDKVLEAAEREYQRARIHIVLATKNVLERAWCLYEIAVRRHFGGTSELLLLAGEEGKKIDQLEMVEAGPFEVLGMIFLRQLLVFSIPHKVGRRLLQSLGINVDKAECLTSEKASLSAVINGRFEAAAGNLEAENTAGDFFCKMQAKLEVDKSKIKAKALDVFGTQQSFNYAIQAATLRTSCGRLELALLLWLESGVFLVGIAPRIASAALSLLLTGVYVLCHLCLRLCGVGLFAVRADEPLVVRCKMTRLGASALTVWICLDLIAMLPVVLILGAAVAAIWAVPSALLLFIGHCSGCVHRRWTPANQAQEGSYARRGKVSMEMVFVLIYVVVSPTLVLPVALICLLWLVFDFCTKRCLVVLSAKSDGNTQTGSGAQQVNVLGGLGIMTES